jgi:hypothetical protein
MSTPSEVRRESLIVVVSYFSLVSFVSSFSHGIVSKPPSFVWIRIVQSLLPWKSERKKLEGRALLEGVGRIDRPFMDMDLQRSRLALRVENSLFQNCLFIGMNQRDDSLVLPRAQSISHIV